MLEVRRNGERLKRFVGKLLSDKLLEAVAEFLAREFAGFPLELHANEFEPVGLATAETLDGQRKPFIGMIGNGEHAPRKIELLGPNMKKGLFARAAHLPGHSGEGRDPATVFPHFDGA